MRELIRTAQDRSKSDQYVAHCAGILARDEGIPEAAIADPMRIEQVRNDIEARIGAHLEAATRAANQ